MLMIQWNQKFQCFFTLQLLGSSCTSLKQNLFWNNSQNEAILISNDFLVPQLHPSRQKCVENVSAINLTQSNFLYVFLMYLSLHRVQKFYTRYFDPFTFFSCFYLHRKRPVVWWNFQNNKIFVLNMHLIFLT